MKLKLQPHHIAEIEERRVRLTRDLYHPDGRECAADLAALLDHIEVIEEELRYANEFLASLPPIKWRDLEEMSQS